MKKLILVLFLVVLLSGCAGSVREFGKYIDQERVEGIVRVIKGDHNQYSFVIQETNSNRFNIYTLAATVAHVTVIADVPADQKMWIHQGSVSVDNNRDSLEIHVHSSEDIN